jgi:hypothetical protein
MRIKRPRRERHSLLLVRFRRLMSNQLLVPRPPTGLRLVRKALLVQRRIREAKTINNPVNEATRLFSPGQSGGIMGLART